MKGDDQMNYPYFGQQMPTGGAPNYFQNPVSQPPTQTQPLFPQPSGNVYNINNSLEVANVPIGAGFSVALCMSEGVMYLKSMQNGSPMFWAYKISSYDARANGGTQSQSQTEENQDGQALLEELKLYKGKVDALEKQMIVLKQTLKTGGKDNEG